MTDKVIFILNKIKRNISLDFLIFIFILIFFSWSYYFFCTQGTYKFHDINQGYYYRELASVFEKGKLGIPGNQPGADWSYYNGVNYLYYGPLPVILWLILKHVFNIITTFSKLTLIFSVINFIIFYVLLVDMVKYLKIKKNLFIKYIFLILYGFGSLYFLSARYLVYETAIVFGSTFMILSFLIFVKYLNYEGNSIVKKITLLFTSSISLTFGLFSRFNIIFSLFPYLLFIIYKGLKNKNKKNNVFSFYETWFFISVFMFPIILGVSIHFYYNFLRYNNPFEFGLTYSGQQDYQNYLRLTGNKSIAFNYFLLNIRQLLFLIPKISLSSPFITYIQPAWLVGEYPKLLVVSKTSSFFFSSPLLLFLFYIPFGILKKLKNKIRHIVHISFMTLVLISLLIYSLFYFTYCRRYFQDYYFLLTLLAFIGCGYFYEKYIEKSTRKIIFFGICIIFLGWTFIIALNLNCQWAFNNDYSRCFTIYNSSKTFIPLN